MSMGWSPQSAANAYMDTLKLVSGFTCEMNLPNVFMCSVRLHSGKPVFSRELCQAF